MVIDKNKTLPLMEHFYTIQGEGYYQGYAAYFLRLGGCDVGCTWCDVKESWDAGAHPQVSIAQMCKWVTEAKAPMVVITGGEPAMHPLTDLVLALQEAGVEVNIETSGTHALSAKLDWLCLSPKRFKKCREEYYTLADELKVVIFHENDFRWAEQLAAKVSPECQLYLQPEWSVRESITPLIIEYVKNHPRWAISLQIHKYLGVD
jgi:hypothetical protein